MTLKFEKITDSTNKSDLRATDSYYDYAGSSWLDSGYPSKFFSWQGFKGVTYDIFGMSQLTPYEHPFQGVFR